VAGVPPLEGSGFRFQVAWRRVQGAGGCRDPDLKLNEIAGWQVREAGPPSHHDEKVDSDQ